MKTYAHKSPNANKHRNQSNPVGNLTRFAGQRDNRISALNDIANSKTNELLQKASNSKKEGVLQGKFNTTIQLIKRSDLEVQARTAADENAIKLQAQKTGHGRKPHGRDASAKAKRYGGEEAVANSQQDVWQKIYDQTLNRLLKKHQKDLKN